MNLEKNNDFFGYVYNIFSEFAQKKPELINLQFSRKIEYPLLNRFPKISVTIPLPRFKDGLFFFEGFVFEDNPEQRCNLWILFLASIYHLASHVAVSRYSIYEKWVRHKTEEVYDKVIDFIEDTFVEMYVSSNNLEAWKNMTEINDKLIGFENDISKINKKNKKIIPNPCYIKDTETLEKIRISIKEIDLDSNYQDKVLKIADLLYANRHLLAETTLPYCEHGDGTKNAVLREKTNFQFELDDEFKEIAYRLDELWTINEQTRARLFRQYNKHLKGLHFDSIVISPENFHEFAQIREKILPMIKRIRQQIRMIVNVTDLPKTDQIGQVDMQMAIQSIASKGRLIEVFERDENRRVEEAWVILIDKSASMRLRFDHIKEFTICVAEAANELTGKSDAWAMYSFDNNFQILKDFKEKYGQQVQSRLGGLQNNGLSLLPDAIEISYRILAADPREKKYLFVITDGHPSGYERIQEHFLKIAKKVDMSEIILVAIGVSKATSKRFRNSARSTDLKQLVAKFITAYRTASSDM